jgi:hypothetical protein
MTSSECEAAMFAMAYILINAGVCMYLITTMPDNIIHICIATVAVNIVIVVLLEYSGVAKEVEVVEAAAAATAAKKKDDDYMDGEESNGAEDADADSAAGEEIPCHEIIYEINMSDMIDIILEKLQERVELHDVEGMRETLTTAYCAMNTSPIDLNIIDTVVDMVLMCTKKINMGIAPAAEPTASAD